MTLTIFQALELEDQEAVTKILNDNPESASERDAENRTPLHYAAEIPNRTLFEQLLAADPSLIDSEDTIGFTPLFIAVTSGNLEVLRYLIEKGSQLDHTDLDKHSVAHWAVVCGQLEALQELIRSEAPISTPDLHGAHPLHYAVTLDDVPPKRAEAILNALLKAENQDVNCLDADNRTPFLWASSCGNTSAMQRLIEGGANKYATDRDNLNALHCAANHGYTDAVSLLLKQSNRKLMEGKDKNGDTPLFYASTYGHYECARLLLEANADPNHVDKRLRTAQHCAAAKGQMRVLKLLRQFGASYDMQNYRGDLPFHEAVQTGNSEVVNWLLDLNPANLNVGNYYGRTALHLSAANGDLELVKLLCDKGAQPNSLMIFRNQMCTPLDLAKQRKHQLVVDYLENQQHAKHANEMPTNVLMNERADIEENVKSAKIRYNRARENGSSEADEQKDRLGAMSSLNKRLMLKMQRRSSSLAEDSPLEYQVLLPKSTSTSDLRLPPIQDRQPMANKGAQTDEQISQNMGRELVEEVIRKVVGEPQWQALTNYSSNSPTKTGNHLPKIGKKSKSKDSAKQVESDYEEDYPHLVATDDEKAFNSYFNSPKQKPKKVTLPVENGQRRKWRKADENDYELDEIDDTDFQTRVHTLANLLQNGAASGALSASSTNQNMQFVHEKAIFQELTHLKRTQIQYGKVQERVLVRSLINNFCKMHGLNPAHFRYNSFYAWEKFLYDQLKLIYLEERDRIQALGAPRSAVQFERRLRKVEPLNERLRELTRIYNHQGSLTRSLSKPSPEHLANGDLSLQSTRRERGAKNWAVSKNGYSQSSDREPTGHGKRCACLEDDASRSHSHLLLNNV